MLNVRILAKDGQVAVRKSTRTAQNLDKRDIIKPPIQ
jgi:hypothetical protein